MDFKDVMAANDAKIAKERERAKLDKVLFWNSEDKDTCHLTYFMTLEQVEQLQELCDKLNFPLNYIFVPCDKMTPIWGE